MILFLIELATVNIIHFHVSVRKGEIIFLLLTYSWCFSKVVHLHSLGLSEVLNSSKSIFSANARHFEASKRHL